MPHFDDVDSIPEVGEELSRAIAELRRESVDAAVLTSCENVTYTTGFPVPMHVGPIAAFAGVWPLAIAVIDCTEEQVVLIVADAYLQDAVRAVDTRRCQVLSFPTFGHFEPVDCAKEYGQHFTSVLSSLFAGIQPKVVAVEYHALPVPLHESLVDALPRSNLVSAQQALNRARWTKTSREIALLRRVSAIADEGQRALVELARTTNSPTSEIELWSKIECRMAALAGSRLTITGELVSGPRIATVAPGGPINRRVHPGDSGLMDISPRYAGYWADCTNTVVFGGPPSSEQRRYFRAARDAFETAVSLLRPGTKCSDIEQAVRKTFAAHGFPIAHYSGHQVGVSVNEQPRLVPYDHSIVEPGMVFAIEPGVYAGPEGSLGARAERMVLVTEDGPEILSQFPWGID
ncbi:MAG: Xaa-Pro peptidase family protein [Alicyclobacillus sp.]|nr:Xaa-Pro peptidase family protein [Alicyclobacillus sp.]